jgi:hypothetical protein
VVEHAGKLTAMQWNLGGTYPHREFFLLAVFPEVVWESAVIAVVGFLSIYSW